MARRRKKKHKTARPPVPRPQGPTCSLCGEPAHQGDSEETLAALAVLDEEAAVYYDEQLATHAAVADLCGPRFRQNNAGLFAHYGSPHGERYVVFQWDRESKSWRSYLESHRADRGWQR